MAVLERYQVTPEDAQKYAGKWVAIKDSQVLFASDDPGEVIAWAREANVELDLVAALPNADDPDIWMM